MELYGIPASDFARLFGLTRIQVFRNKDKFETVQSPYGLRGGEIKFLVNWPNASQAAALGGIYPNFDLWDSALDPVLLAPVDEFCRAAGVPYNAVACCREKYDWAPELFQGVRKKILLTEKNIQTAKAVYAAQRQR